MADTLQILGLILVLLAGPAFAPPETSLTFTGAGTVKVSSLSANQRVNIGRFDCPGGKISRKVDIQWHDFTELQVQVEPDTAWLFLRQFSKSSEMITSSTVAMWARATVKSPTSAELNLSISWPTQDKDQMRWADKLLTINCG